MGGCRLDIKDARNYFGHCPILPSDGLFVTGIHWILTDGSDIIFLLLQHTTQHIYSLCANFLWLSYWGREMICRHFPDDIFEYIFSNKNVYISIKISLNSVPKGPINNISAMVEIMAPVKATSHYLNQWW